MTSAIVRIGERVEPVRVRLVAWIGGSKARFADLHALRRGKMPVLDGQMSLRRQLAFAAFAIGGSACIAGYGLAIVALVWSHSEPVVRVSPRQAEVVIAPADLDFDVARLVGSHDTVIEQI